MQDLLTMLFPPKAPLRAVLCALICSDWQLTLAGMELMRASSVVNADRQQAEASTSGTHHATDALRDAASIALCIQAVQSSCLLPFLDRQLENASFNDMASR